MQIGRLLGLNELGAQRFWRDHIAQADAGGKHLGERTHIHGAFRSQRADRRRRVARVGQFAVRIVFEDEQIEFARLLGKLIATFLGQQAPGGVLEIRQAVEEFRPAQRFAHGLRDHAVVVGRNGNVLRLEQRKCLQRAKIGRRLNQNSVTRIDQHLGEKVEPLLRA